MAKLEYFGQTYTNEDEIHSIMNSAGILFERWPLHRATSDDQILKLYESEINYLMQTRGYVAADMVALKSTTPNLTEITSRYNKEHHHTDDEVRFTVEGEGVFEIEDNIGKFLKFTATPGDLIIIPAYRRHLFYLTQQSNIRCIRLFLDKNGWEAIYNDFP
jgi:1,2-dihydroxy-3-keto-5-methylthiopentene dioxygenase